MSRAAMPAVLVAKLYRRHGDESWDPALLGPIPTQAQRKAARVAEFARLREQGTGIAAASARVGVSRETGRAYERARLAGGGR
jgi:hypothetical protein